MCGKPAVNTSVLSSEEDDKDLEENGLINGEEDDDGSSSESEDVKVKRENETAEEKKQRRKIERKKRIAGKRQARGELVTKSAPKKVISLFNRIWEEESAYVTQVMQCLPEVRQPGLVIDEDERTEEYISIMKPGGKGVQDEEREKEKAREKIRRNLKREGVELIGERAKSYMELKERLQQKLAGKAQKPNVEKREKKLKKKLKRKQEAKEKSNKGKKLISQSASTAGGSGGAEDSSDVKSETPEKTPLQKKPVVKSNGEIVYSKFDFISKEARSNGIGGSSTSASVPGKFKKALKAEDLLKKAEKHEKKISSLVSTGKQSEAVDLAISQKWDTALKRADGEKVRDDKYLLKKTIKKQEKLKQLTKKKWKERVERVEKMKEQRQQKRQTNIQTRKDDKKKRSKKLLRKRGRIA